MVAEGRQPSLASAEKMSSFRGNKNQVLGGNILLVDGSKQRNLDLVNKSSRGAFVIKENSGDGPKKIIHLEGKGKSISKDFEIVIPRLDKGLLSLNSIGPFTSSSGMKIFVNEFGNSNEISGNSVINVNSCTLDIKNFHVNDSILKLGEKKDVL